MVECANKTFREKVSIAKATRIFGASGHSPYFLRQAITVGRLRQIALAQALDVVIEETLNEESLARRWSRLSAVERAVALAVMGEKPPRRGLARGARQGDRQGGKIHQVQNALLRLEREGFLERAMRGGYAVSDPMAAIWLERMRGLSGPRLPPSPR